jgi:hypothetical protein
MLLDGGSAAAISRLITARRIIVKQKAVEVCIFFTIPYSVFVQKVF